MKGFKKIGLMFLAMVIALAGVGVGYAAWTDTVTIEGTVNTGSVELEILELSGTKVWKTLDDHGLVQRDWVMDFKLHPAVPPPANSILVAESGARVGGDGEADIVMWWTNIFPSIDFEANVLFHYNGSIPVRVKEVLFDWTGDAALALLDFDVTATLVDADDPDDLRIGETVDEGYQLHFSDEILLVVTINVPQLDAVHDISGSADASIEVIQWNKYPYTPD